MGKAHRMHNHQRHTTSFDKFLPPEPVKTHLRRFQQRLGCYRHASSVERQVCKRMQARKQRQWNRRVLREAATDEEARADH